MAHMNTLALLCPCTVLLQMQLGLSTGGSKSLLTIDTDSPPVKTLGLAIKCIGVW